jgi:hypothetical protein
MAEAFDAAIRDAARKRRIPPDACCADCGFSDARALEALGKHWQCYNCANAARGRPLMEAHHVFGKDTDTMTIPVDGNQHRILSDLELEIDAEVKALAADDPLAWIIRGLWSVYNFFRATLAHLARAIVWLTRLLGALRERHGKHWATELGLADPW